MYLQYWCLFIQTIYLALVIKSHFISNKFKIYDYLNNYYILDIYDYSKNINESILYKEKFLQDNKKNTIKFYINNKNLVLLSREINFLQIYNNYKINKLKINNYNEKIYL